MITQATPPIACEQAHPALSVSDALAAVKFYTKKFGFSLGFTLGRSADDNRREFGSGASIPGASMPNSKGCRVCFVIDDADELYDNQRANGVEIVEPPEDRQYGLGDYTIRDPGGYHLSFGHCLRNVGLPLNIERVEIAVRLEKPLAALLHDLAEPQAHERE
jgi:catechol 2,3-dioxygenase-like lactoylglutathione lyase family enzyme